MRRWFPYPWQRSTGRSGTCGICHENVKDQDIVCALYQENWCHELCALRARVAAITADETTHSGTQRQLIAAIHDNAVVGISYNYAMGRHARYNWTERKQ